MFGFLKHLSVIASEAVMVIDVRGDCLCFFLSEKLISKPACQ